MICANSQSFCFKGPSGPGGCYPYGYGCRDGMICANSQNFCLKGTSGSGGCYGYGYKCANGKICSTTVSNYCLNW